MTSSPSAPRGANDQLSPIRSSRPRLPRWLRANQRTFHLSQGSIDANPSATMSRSPPNGSGSRAWNARARDASTRSERTVKNGAGFTLDSISDSIRSKTSERTAPGSTNRARFSCRNYCSTEPLGGLSPGLFGLTYVPTSLRLQSLTGCVTTGCVLSTVAERGPTDLGALPAPYFPAEIPCRTPMT